MSVPILLYHNIVTSSAHQAKPGLVVSVARFRLQMLVLRMLGYHTVSLNDLAQALKGRCEISSPGHSVIITFDDGYSGVYEQAFPLLRKHGFTASIFLIAQDFDRRIDGLRAFPILTPSQANEMLKVGFEIGSHSLTHPHLPQLLQSQLADEVVQPKEILQQTFQVPITLFAYPYGEYTSGLEKFVAASGYECAVTTRMGRVHTPEERYSLKRISVGAEQRIPHFVYRLLWATQGSDKEGTRVD